VVVAISSDCIAVIRAPAVPVFVSAFAVTVPDVSPSISVISIAAIEVSVMVAL